MQLNSAYRKVLFKNEQQNSLFFPLYIFLLCVRELYQLCGVIAVTCKWCMKRKIPVLPMHQENTGSSQQTQVCCLFILNSSSSSKDRELKDNSHLFNYLYCYFKGDTFKGSLSLPLYLLTSPPSCFKDFIFKGMVSKVRGSSLGRGGICKGSGAVLSDTTGKNFPKDWPHNQRSHWHTCEKQKKTP